MKISEDFIIENGCLKSYIGNDADVIIPDTIIEIDEFAFDDCKNVISITIPESVLKINDCAFYCRNLTTVVLSNNIKEIGMNIFDGCIKLSTFIFPDGISEYTGSVVELFWENIWHKRQKTVLAYCILKQYPQFIHNEERIKRKIIANKNHFIEKALSEDDPKIFEGLFTISKKVTIEEIESYLHQSEGTVKVKQFLNNYYTQKSR